MNDRTVTIRSEGGILGLTGHRVLVIDGAAPKTFASLLDAIEALQKELPGGQRLRIALVSDNPEPSLVANSTGQAPSLSLSHEEAPRSV